jgi:hypothetical protein
VPSSFPIEYATRAMRPFACGASNSITTFCGKAFALTRLASGVCSAASDGP